MCYAKRRVWRLRPPLRPSASNEFASLIRLNFLAVLEIGPLSTESPPARGALDIFSYFLVVAVDFFLWKVLVFSVYV